MIRICCAGHDVRMYQYPVLWSRFTRSSILRRPALYWTLDSPTLPALAFSVTLMIGIVLSESERALCQDVISEEGVEALREYDILLMDDSALSRSLHERFGGSFICVPS